MAAAAFVDAVVVDKVDRDIVVVVVVGSDTFAR